MNLLLIVLAIFTTKSTWAYTAAYTTSACLTYESSTSYSKIIIISELLLFVFAY